MQLYEQLNQKVQDMLANIKNCQNEHQIVSCLKCQKVIGCKLRKEYVDSVYSKMNNGKGGGFEF